MLEKTRQSKESQRAEEIAKSEAQLINDIAQMKMILNLLTPRTLGGVVKKTLIGFGGFFVLLVAIALENPAPKPVAPGASKVVPSKVVADPPVEKIDPNATFTFAFRDKIHQTDNWEAKKEALAIFRANEPDYELFAKNSCQLKQDFNGDAQAAGENYIKVNEYMLPISAADKAEVYQMQFDALNEAGLCQ